MRLREAQVDHARYTKTRIEIQVASILMHSWAEVEHDLVYKPRDTALSKDEHASLDIINGLIMVGEIALTRLQEAIDARASQPENFFVDHYELAMHLRRAIEPSFPASENSVIMGRVDVLFRFLQLADMDRPDRLDQYVTGLDPDTDSVSVMEQIVDRIIQGHPSLEAKYEQAREESGVRNPYSSTLERSSKLEEAEAYGNFMLRWGALENFVGFLALTRGSAASPLQVVEQLRRLELVDASTLNQIDDIRRLRNDVVHRQSRVDVAKMNEATQFLERLMRAPQFQGISGVGEIIEQANAASNTDALTGLSNRRAFERRAFKEFAQHSQNSISLLLLDVDSFKSINDTYGHAVGDQVIKEVADALRASTRSTDAIARYGGEEFCVLLPDTDKEQALGIAEQYRQAVGALSVALQDSPPLTSLTISIGVSTVVPAAIDWHQCLHEADLALYRAKRSGRNRVVHSTDAPEE